MNNPAGVGPNLRTDTQSTSVTGNGMVIGTRPHAG